MIEKVFNLSIQFLDFLWSSFLLLAPMLLLGLFLSGLIHVFISRQAILRWFRRDDLKSVATSAAIGVPVPLCSCSVVPVVAEMRKKGASRSSCMSFLITAPETGADSILVTNAFFGPVAAVARPIISFITAVFAGIFCIGLIRGDSDAAKKKSNAPAHDHDHGHGHGHGHDHDHDHGAHQSLIPGQEDCYVSPVQLKDTFVRWLKELSLAASRWSSISWIKPEFYRESLQAEGMQDSAASPGQDAGAPAQTLDFRKITRHIFRYGFVEVADDILFALLIGILIGGVLYLAIPSDLMAHEYARWISYPVMVLFGVPLYICASGSTPIAAALVAKGFSPGAALIFLMTGPATNTGTIAIVIKQFGVRFASVYVGAVIAVTVALGILVDVLLIATGFSISVNMSASDSPGLLFLQWAGALTLAALIVWRFRSGALKSGWEDMMMNVRPWQQSLGRTWDRITRSRAVRGGASVVDTSSWFRFLNPATPLGRGIYASILAVFLGSGFTVVPPESVGYGRLFGSVHWRDLPPGLHYLAPRPFVQVDKWPVREVKSLMAETPYEYMSGDLNLLAVTVNLQYRVKDPYMYHYKIDNAAGIIQAAVRAHTRAFLSARKLDMMLNIHRVELEEEIGHLFDSADHNQNPTLASVELVKLNLLVAHPVAETMSAFREVSSAQEDRERIIVNASRFLISLIPQAHGNAVYEVKQAEGQSFRRVKTADAESDAISMIATAVSSAPRVLQNMLWREKLETALSGNSKIIVPQQDSLDKVALWKKKATPTGVSPPHHPSTPSPNGHGSKHQ